LPLEGRLNGTLVYLNSHSAHRSLSRCPTPNHKEHSTKSSMAQEPLSHLYSQQPSRDKPALLEDLPITNDAGTFDPLFPCQFGLNLSTTGRGPRPSLLKRAIAFFACDSLFTYVFLNAVHWYNGNFNNASKLKDTPLWQLFLCNGAAYLCSLLTLYRTGYRI
jgi:hypothetical protein